MYSILFDTYNQSQNRGGYVYHMRKLNGGLYFSKSVISAQRNQSCLLTSYTHLLENCRRANSMPTRTTEIPEPFVLSFDKLTQDHPN